MSETWKHQVDQVDFNSDGQNEKDLEARDVAKKVLEKAQKKMTPKAFEEFFQDATKIMERQETDLSNLENLLQAEKAQTKIEFSLQRHNIRLKGLQDNLKFINDSKVDTGLLEHTMDLFVRSVSDQETPQEMYTRMYNEAKENSYKHIALIQKELENPEIANNMTQEQKEKFKDIIIEYKKLGLSSAKKFDLLQTTINTIQGIPEATKNAVHGIKGTAIGVYEGGKMLVEGVFDLSKFLVKYAGSYLIDNPEYREKIHKQCADIWEAAKDVDSTVILDIMGKEWDKIMALPSEQQAEAIGKFSGNVIAMLGSMGLLGKGSKAINTLSKAQKARGASAMSGEVLSTQAARVGMFVLNGPAEELIGGGLAKSFKALANKLKGAGALDMKLGEVNKTIGEFEEALEKAKSPKKKETLEQALEAMKKEKEGLDAQKRSLDETLKTNGKLSDSERIIEAQKLIGDLSEQQQEAIIKAHNIGAGKEGAHTPAELREKAKILKEAGISDVNRRVLMENGITGEFERFRKGFGKLYIPETRTGDLIEMKTKNGSIYQFEKLENGNYKLILGSNKKLVDSLPIREGKLEVTENGGIKFHNGEDGFTTSEIDDMVKREAPINPLKRKFDNAQSIEEILKILKENGGIQGSTEFFNYTIIEKRIQDYINGVGGEIGITSSAGLRKKVIELKREGKIGFDSNKPIRKIENIKIHPNILGADNNIHLLDAVKNVESPNGIRISGASDKGIDYGKVNEDRLVIDSKNEFVSAIDGMGGGSSGDKAAQIVAEELSKNPNNIPQAIENAKNRIQHIQLEAGKGNPGAAFVSAKIRRENGKIFVDQHSLGDCQLVVIRNGKVKHVSKQDGYVDKKIQNGELTPDQALYEPRRNQIADFVAPGKDSKVRREVVEVQPGDRVLLMSDGISDNLTPNELAYIVDGKSSESALQEIGKITDERMRNRKNIVSATGDRSRVPVYTDGYKSMPKADNRGIIVMDIEGGVQKRQTPELNTNILKGFESMRKSDFSNEILAKYPGSKPTKEIDMGGHKLLVGNAVQLKNGYKEAVGFVEVNGQLEPRLFYKSKSDGSWRSTPGRRYDGEYSKGDHLPGGYNYVTTTKVSNSLDNQLNRLTIIEKENGFLKDFGRKIDELTSPRNNKSFITETKIFDHKGVLNFLQKGKTGALGEDFKNATYEDVVNHIQSLNSSYPKKFIPNFRKGPINTEFVDHTLLGKTKIEVFEGTLNGEKIHWEMAQNVDNPEKIWISNIRLADSNINSFGVDSEFIDAGILNTKPFDYTDQIPIEVRKRLKYSADGKYADLTPLLAKIKPIQEYKQYLREKGTWKEKIKNLFSKTSKKEQERFNNIVKKRDTTEKLEIGIDEVRLADFELLKSGDIIKYRTVSGEVNELTFLGREDFGTQLSFIDNNQNSIIMNPRANKIRSSSIKKGEEFLPGEGVIYTLEIIKYGKSFDNQVAQVTSFKDLFKVIQESNDIGEYNPEALVQLIKNIQDGSANIDAIPSKYGIREKVILLKNEESMKTAKLSYLWPHISAPTNQGSVGNCYFVSALNSIKRLHNAPEVLGDMIRKNKNGDYIVKFKGYHEEVIISKKDIAEMGDMKQGSVNKGDIILERAHAKIKNKIRGYKSGNTYQIIDRLGQEPDISSAGGQMIDTWKLMFGDSFTEGVQELKRMTDNGIKEALKETDVVTLGSIPRKEGESKRYLVDTLKGKIELTKGHAYSIAEYNLDEGWIAVINPHNSGERLFFTPEQMRESFKDIQFGRFE